MNRYQIALDNLCKHCEVRKIAYDNPQHKCVGCFEKALLQELVDKATPKKVTCGWCAVCHAHIEVDLPFKDEYCHYCGQRLEYEGEKNI